MVVAASNITPQASQRVSPLRRTTPLDDVHSGHCVPVGFPDAGVVDGAVSFGLIDDIGASWSDDERLAVGFDMRGSFESR